MIPVQYRWDVFGHRPAGRPGPWFHASRGRLSRACRALKMPRERLRVRYDNGQEVVYRPRRPPPILGLHAPRRRTASCVIVRADAWKPNNEPGKRFAYCIVRFDGQNYMRLFEDARSRDFYLRRVWRHSGRRPSSVGYITFKEPKP